MVVLEEAVSGRRERTFVALRQLHEGARVMLACYDPEAQRNYVVSGPLYAVDGPVLCPTHDHLLLGGCEGEHHTVLKVPHAHILYSPTVERG